MSGDTTVDPIALTIVAGHLAKVVNSYNVSNNEYRHREKTNTTRRGTAKGSERPSIAIAHQPTPFITLHAW